MRGKISSRESSRSRPGYRKSRIRYAFSVREWFRLSSRRLGTKLAGRYRRESATSLAGGQTNGEHNEADYVQCRSQHHEGNKPGGFVSFGGRRRLNILRCHILS